MDESNSTESVSLTTPFNSPHQTCANETCSLDMSGVYKRLTELMESPTIEHSQVVELPDVVETDSCNDLKMYCYTPNCVFTDDLTPDCRGLVFDNTGKLISRAFGYTPMYSVNEVPPDVKEYVSSHLEHCKVYPAVEGTLIRFFYHQDQWYMTTHRKLDAFKSYWGGKVSFGDMFIESLEDACVKSEELRKLCPSEILLESFLHLLDTSKQYVFLVGASTENRIVCKSQGSQMFLVATFENGVQTDSNIVGIPRQSPLSFESYQDLEKYVHETDPFKYQGVVVFMPNGKQVKICPEKYTRLFNLRGNESSVMYRYLQVRNAYADEYRSLYPEYASRMDMYENVLDTIAKNILHSYRLRFIQQQVVVLPQEEFRVMSAVHTWYKTERSRGKLLKVKQEDVKLILNTQSPTALNKMVRRFLSEN